MAVTETVLIFARNAPKASSFAMGFVLVSNRFVFVFFVLLVCLLNLNEFSEKKKLVVLTI